MSTQTTSLAGAVLSLILAVLVAWWRHQGEQERRAQDRAYAEEQRRRDREDQERREAWAQLIARVEDLEKRASASAQNDARHDAILERWEAVLTEMRADVREIRAVILRESRR